MKNQNEDYKIYHLEKGRLNQEKLVRVHLIGGMYKVSVVSRDDIKHIYESFDENETILITILLCDKIYNRVENDKAMLRELRVEARLMNVNQIENILKCELDETLYSVNGKKNNAICIVPQEDNHRVFYYSESMNFSIVENVSFPRGIVVMRNYALLLKAFLKSYKRLAIDLDSKNEHYDTLLRAYFTAY